MTADDHWPGIQKNTIEYKMQRTQKYNISRWQKRNKKVQKRTKGAKSTTYRNLPNTLKNNRKPIDKRCIVG